MKKCLSEEQFQEAIKDLKVGQQTIDIAHGVLVEGEPQATFVSALGLSKGAVSQAVNRVWTAHEALDVPKGYERLTVMLPEHQAFIVKKWAENTSRKLGLE
jgi:hypothetical protein